MEEHIIPEDELIQIRKDKLEKLREMGKDPFSVERYERYAKIISDGTEESIEPFSLFIIDAYSKVEPKEEGAQPSGRVEVSIAGRVVSH
ncbi:MAG: hypothetical protein SNJ70_05900, partial [Armatimonadota bacterium]